jgi:ABC-type protease/lipase transport system fused ATPase/permease subunit
MVSLFIFLTVFFIVLYIGIDENSVDNDGGLEELSVHFKSVFSTLAQVFGAFLGLAVIVISTVILGYERDSEKPLKCLKDIKIYTKFALYPLLFVLVYSIFFLILAPFAIAVYYKVIIIICGMEIPMLAIFSQTVLVDIIKQCIDEKIKSFTINDFLLDKNEYLTGETLNATLTVENVGSDALKGLRAKLSLKDSHRILKASSLNAAFDVASGESKTVCATLSQHLPHGSYLAEVNVINSTGDVLVSSSEDIYINPTSFRVRIP